MNARVLARSLTCLAFGAIVAAAPAQDFYQRNMIDYDQRREGLPLFGGMYCAPTSYSDLFRFMSKHGMPYMCGIWNQSFSDTTGLIQTLANVMGTSPLTGTTNPFDVMVDWTEAHTSVLVVHVGYGPKTNFGPTALKSLAGMGGMVAVAYGRYKRNPYLPGFGWYRDGGHVVALAGYDWTGSDKKILVADPANDDGNVLVQGPFSIDAKIVSPITLTTTAGDVLHLPRYTLNTGKLNERRDVVDLVHAMLPMFAGWFSTPVVTKSMGRALTDGDSRKPIFHASFPFQLEDGENRPIHDVEVAMPGPVRDWCMDHGTPAIYVLGEDNLVSRVDLFTKTTERVAMVPGATKLAVAGTNLDLYFLVEGRGTDEIVRIDRNSGERTTTKVPKGISGLEPDPDTRGIMALYPERKLVASFDEKLRTLRNVHVELPVGNGAPFFSVDESGKITLGRDGAKSLIQVSPKQKLREMVLEAPMALRDFQAAGTHRFVAQDGDRLVTLDAEGRRTPSQFDGLRVSGRVRFSQSWRAMMPTDAMGPGWYNLPPDFDRGQ